jgi:hypothetical protein
LGQGHGLGDREIVGIILQLSLGGLSEVRGRVGIVGIGEWDAVGARIGAIEHVRGLHMEEHHSQGLVGHPSSFGVSPNLFFPLLFLFLFYFYKFSLKR